MIVARLIFRRFSRLQTLCSHLIYQVSNIVYIHRILRKLWGGSCLKLYSLNLCFSIWRIFSIFVILDFIIKSLYKIQCIFLGNYIIYNLSYNVVILRNIPKTMRSKKLVVAKGGTKSEKNRPRLFHSWYDHSTKIYKLLFLNT